MRKWLLPEAIEDVLPVEAARVEALRRALLDHFRARGYRLVQPPLVEYPRLAAHRHRPRSRPAHVQDRRSAVGPPAGLARRHDAAGRAHRRASAERGRRHAPVLRGQRAAHRDRRAGRHAPGRADRRRALRSRRHRGRPRSDAASAVRARRGQRCADCISTSVTSASIARSRTPPDSRQAAKATMPSSSPRCATRMRPAVHELTAALPEPARSALRALAGLYGPADATLAAARDVLPALPASRRRSRRWRSSRAPPPASTRSMSTSPTCAAITTTRAPRSRCSRKSEQRRDHRLRPRRPLRRRRSRVRPRAPGHRILARPAPPRRAPARRREQADRPRRRTTTPRSRARSPRCARSGEAVVVALAR